MAVHTLRRRIGTLGTALALGLALPLTVGATPASAAPQPSAAKPRVGEVLCAVTASVVVLGDSDCGTSVRLLPIDLSDLFPLFHSGGTASTGTTATK